MKRNNTNQYTECPETLTEHPFYGLDLDNEQIIFRDTIWDDSKKIIFCNSKAGCGKTLIATATANLLVKYGKFDGIVYIAAPTQEQKLGFLPGSVEEKTAPYYEPFYQALETIGVNTNTAMFDDIMNEKNGTAYIECTTQVYLRGCNFQKKVIIIDEMENFYTDECKKVLTRIHDDCKVICIGHTGQIDLYSHPYNSGFERYLNHFAKANDERVAVCELNTNHRGWISTYADSYVGG